MRETLAIRLRACISKRPLLRSSGVLVGGTGISQMTAVLLSPVLSRLYGPTDFGILAIYSTAVAFGAVFATLRLESAVALPVPQEQARLFMSIALSWMVGVVTAISLSLLFAGETCLQALHLMEFRDFLWLVPVGIMALALYSLFAAYALRAQNYGLIASTRVKQAVGNGATSVGGGLAFAGPAGLLLANVVQNSLGTISLIRFFLSGQAAPSPAFKTFSSMRKLAREYAGFAILCSSSSFLNLAGTILPPFLFAVLYDSATAGEFGFAYRLISLPSVLIGGSVSQVFQAELSARIRNGNRNSRGLFRGVTSRMAYISGAVILAGTCAPYAFPLIFGEEWRTAGDYAFLLAFPSALQLIVSPVSSIALISRRERLQLSMDAIRAFLVIASLMYAHWAELSPYWSVASFSAASSLGYILYYVAYRHVSLST